MIRVGRSVYKNGKRYDPSYHGFKSIVILMKSHSVWWALSPYYLYDERGRIFENIWQGSKVYKTVPKVIQKKSRYDKTIIWHHPDETHVIKGKLTKKYLKWREKLMNNPEPVRYPVGFKHRHKCLYAYGEHPDGSIDVSKKLDYISARKTIYAKEYCRLVKQHPQYNKLKKMLNNGTNLLIIEVDGPHQESLDYYKQKYNVDDDFIDGFTMLATKKNLKIMLNDERFANGHGYVLASALLGLDKRLYK